MQDKLAKVVARCWSDEAFRSRLKSDPKTALREVGVEFPDNVHVNVVENSVDTVNLVLPVRPHQRTLSYDQLEAASKEATVSDCCLMSVSINYTACLDCR